MNRLLRSAVAIAAIMAACPAIAADLPRGGGPYMMPAQFGVYNWNGAYVGANVGYQWGTLSNSPLSPSGFAGGIGGGYNWQTGQFVLGAEADLQWSGADDTFAAYKFSNPWFGTLRGRAGVAFNNILFYATAGLAYGEGKVEAVGATETQLHVGWTGGGGIEVGLAPNWSAKAEFLFVDLPGRNYVLTGTSNEFQSDLVRLGVNYRF